MLRKKFWMEMAWPDFRDADMANVIAVLPVAAVEQHGPHLPVGVDTFINEGYLRRMVALLPDDLPVLVLPVQQIGKSNEHLHFPGTLTLSAETCIRAWTEIGESVFRAGCRKLVIVNPSDSFAIVANEFGYQSVEAEIGNNSTIRLDQAHMFNTELLNPIHYQAIQ